MFKNTLRFGQFDAWEGNFFSGMVTEINKVISTSHSGLGTSIYHLNPGGKQLSYNPQRQK